MLEELDLLQRAKAFEESALVEIHTRYYTGIFQYLSFRVPDRETAEDLTSEVFTRFLHMLRDKQAPANTINGWLFGAAKLVLKEYYRRQKRDRSVPLNDDLLDSTISSPEHAATLSLDQMQLHHALHSLTEEQQHILALRFGYGMPIKEVAQTVQKSEGAVKMLQARAIAALARRLKGPEVGI